MLSRKNGKFALISVGIIGFLLVTLSVTFPGAVGACVLYGIMGDDLPDGIMVNNLITDSNSMIYGDQSNGWGIGEYADWGATPTFTRSAEKPSVDGQWCDFDGTCVEAGAYAATVSQMDETKPKVVLVHWRTGSSGCGGYVADAHPFYREYDGKTWSFIQNGGCNKERARYLIIDGSTDSEDNDWVNDLPNSSGVLGCYPLQYWKYDEPEGGWVVGDIEWAIDSELYFLLVMKHIKESHANGGTTLDGIVKAIARLLNHGETQSINFIMSDGNTMWGFKRGYTLNYKYDSTTKVTQVAKYALSGTIGEDLDSDGNTIEGTGGGSTGFDESTWVAMEEYQIVVCSKDAEPVVYDIRDLIPGNFNDDTVVDEEDETLLAAAMGSKTGDAAFISSGDFDGNGIIEQSDLNTWEEKRDEYVYSILSDDHSNSAFEWSRDNYGSTYLPLSGASGTSELGCDVDFFRFAAVQGKAYTITTGGENDTGLTLYDTDGETELTDNDDISEDNSLSQIVWTCPASGVYYVKARLGEWSQWGDRTYRNWNAGTGDYTLSLSVSDVVTAEIKIDMEPSGNKDYFLASDLETIPVIIYGTADLDLSSIDTSALTLNGFNVAADSDSVEISDVNGDGYDDVSATFQTETKFFKDGTTDLELLGALSDGEIVQGTSSISVKTSEEKSDGDSGCFVNTLFKLW